MGRSKTLQISPKMDDMQPSPRSVNWTDAELDAAVDAYRSMLHDEEAGKSFNKAEINRKLREGPLAGRTASSIEFRMQNISATLEELCLPRIAGYFPAKNVGTAVKDKIRLILENKGHISKEDYEPSDEDAEIQERVRRLRSVIHHGSPRGNSSPQKSIVNGARFVRDPLIIAFVLKESHGKCEGCGSPAPFNGPAGDPFLEVHHVLPLAQGGGDLIENAVALCPNCHRRCHYSGDRDLFTKTLYATIQRLGLEVRSLKSATEDLGI
jgi:5-methylcytosine-specific restriction protein A